MGTNEEGPCQIRSLQGVKEAIC